MSLWAHHIKPGKFSPRPKKTSHLGVWRRPLVKANKRTRGIALVVAMTAIAILTVMLAEMQENTTTAYILAVNERDQMRAEYMARSGLNLTRLLVSQEPAIRTLVSPLFQSFLGRPPPMIPIWQYANDILRPFCNASEAQRVATESGLDLSAAEGLSDPQGTCDIIAFAENSRINVSKPLSYSGSEAQNIVAYQVFAQTGGYQTPNPYQALFDETDPDGEYTSNLDIISALIDWWDYDTERSSFDPGRGQVVVGGGEDDVYQSFDDPYRPRNAPFDSIEELRLVRGIGDDFWSTFIEPDPNDPRSRLVTIYGSGAVNPNEAPPEVLLARVCSILQSTTLCTDPLEAAKFVQFLTTVRMLAPIPFFSTADDFINFLQSPADIHPILRQILGADNPLLFTPITVAGAQRSELQRLLVTGARIITVDVTGTAGRATTRIRTIMNFHEPWTPAPPNAGTMPPLGIYLYYRIE